MVRPILPKEEQGESPPELDSVPEARSSKRRCVSSACIPCRKRKSKCDGGTPSCSTCTAVYHTECVYDIDSDHRRKGALKRDIETLRERNGALGIIVASIRSSSEVEVADIVQQIRADENLEAIAESLKRSVTLPGRSDSQTLEGEFSDLMGKPSLDDSGETRHYGHSSNLGLVPHEDALPLRNNNPSESWTRATQDAEFVGHLMGLYFCWQHPFYVLFSKECFLHDMARGRSKYCSPLLVNALLAAACAYSDRPEARTNPNDPKTAGDQFFAEARRLLFENENSSLTAVQALALMGSREASCGRDSSGFQYAGRCIRMALELGLHLCFKTAGNSDLSPTEIEVRKITFWGCFTLDTAWAICIGRISQLPRTAISLEKPTIVDAIEYKPWKPYVDFNVPGAPGSEEPSHTHRILRQLSLLSEIVNDTVYMFYAPRERFTSKRLLDFYARYTRWYKALPECLKLDKTSLPQVLCLHMYYHTVVLHLFRPFLKVHLLDSSVSPRGICTKSAENVSSIIDTYRNYYGLRRVCLLMAHILLSSSTVHLLNLPNPSATHDLAQGIRDLKEMSINHAFAGRCLRIIISLGQKWGISLPAEVQQATAAVSPETMLPSPTSGQFFTPLRNSPQLQPHQRRHSVTEMVLPTPSPSSNTASVPSAPSAPAANPTDLFWSPFPYQSMPLQVNPQSGPMDITAMLDVQLSDWERFNRDGFKMASVNDPVLGQPIFYEDWAQA
ncbi:MAG: hypothetical protein M1830_009476 [Pleopsidium flavum]|nr:MAG: hypothetical protein M1830_009476 [Pleopsidium flavum]